MLILKENAANSVPTPPAGKDTFFIDDSGTPSVKNSSGNVTTFPTTAASNAQVLFMNGSAITGDADITWNYNTNVLTVNGNVGATRVLTDNLLYANGVAWDLQDPGGSNTQVQFNDDESFGGSAAFTFNKTTNAVSMSGTVTTGNVYANSGTVGGSLLSITGNANVGNIGGNNGIFTTVSGTLSTAAQPNITSVGTLSSLAVTANVTAGNVYANSGTVGASLLTGTLTTAAQPNVTSVGTLTSATVTGNVVAGNVYANSGTIGASVGNLTTINSGLLQNGNSNVTITANGNVVINAVGGERVRAFSTGATVTGTLAVTANVTSPQLISNVSTGTAPLVVTSTTVVANLRAATSNVANTVNDAAQPNITSVGTLTSLAVTGNGTFGNVYANSGTIGASLLTGTLTTAAQPNITSVGTLTSVAITGNATAGNVYANSGTIGASLLTGTLTTAAQPNITSVGTLTSLTVSGNLSAGNLIGILANGNSNVSIPSANGNINISAGGTPNELVITSTGVNVAGTLNATGNANVNNLGTAQVLASANVTAPQLISNVATGTAPFVVTSTTQVANLNVATAGTAGTVTTAAQPNITSVGTLSSLAVTGNATAGNVYANSGTVGASLLTGTLTTAAQPNITSVGTLTSLSVTGNVAAGNLTTTGVLSVTGTGVSSIAGNLDMTSNTIINLATPTNANDAATKQYVDDVAQGLHTHDSCNAATQTTLAIISGGTVTYNNGSSGVGATLTTTGSYTTIDGVTLSNGMRILVKNEANAAHNGIYDRTSTTVLTRSTDFDTPTEMAGGDFTFVTAGTLYDNTGWVMTDPVTTVGTTNVNWTQFSGAGTYTAGTGLTLTGSQFSVNASQTQITAVGTLTGLAVNGNITAANITANTGVFTGNGSGLSALNASNISSGTLAQARLANSSLTVNGTSISLGGSGTITANTTQTLTLGSYLTGTSFNGGTAVTAAVDATTTNTASKVVARDGSGNFSAGTITATLSGAATTAGTVTTAAQPNITSVGTLTSLTVSGATSVTGNSALTVTNLTSGANTTLGYLTGNWTLTTGSRLQATYADLAEKYVADAAYEPGTVLVFGGDEEVTVSTMLDDHRVAGVVTTDPAYIMNSDCEGTHVATIALQGRVPCKVVGPVAKGDLMVTSFNGYATANNNAKAGTIIGKALADYQGTDEVDGIPGYGVVEIAVGRF